MRHCKNCNTLKEEYDFYKKGNSGFLQHQCKECFNKYVIQRWIDRKLEAIEYKGGKCEDCSNQYHYAVYEFHHLDPTQKDIDWSKMKMVNKEKMLSELDKCVLLCANCHRIRHSNIISEKKKTTI